MDPDWGSPKFVAEQFASWYRTNAATIPAPTEIKQREFAFLMFGGKTMFRHIGFHDEATFRRYIASNAPSHSYHSSSYYTKPDADMSDKGWLGADLVFDIDADHFNLPCQRDHDKWKCRNCEKEGIGKPPEICICGKASYETETWLCERCLQAAKNETQKLLDILIQDFGMSVQGDLITNFSGNRGYHVHVRSQKVRELNQSARREVVDYILGTGIKPEYLGFNPKSKGGRSLLGDEGWRGRAGKALYGYITDAPPQEIKALGLSKTLTQSLTEKKNDFLETLERSPPSFVLSKFAGKDEDQLLADLEKLMECAIKEQAAEIDTVVTTDIHRLIRLPNTLHGKTGWQVQTIQPEHLADYDPLISAITFKTGSVKLYVKYAPRFRIIDAWYGPYHQEEVDVPTAAAIFLLCKKGARIIQ